MNYDSIITTAVLPPMPPTPLKQPVGVTVLSAKTAASPAPKSGAAAPRPKPGQPVGATARR